MAIWLPDSPATSKKAGDYLGGYNNDRSITMSTDDQLTWNEVRKMILTRTFKHPAIGVSEKVFATFAKEWVGTEPYMILSDIISSYNLGELEKLEEVGELLKLFGTPHGV